MEHRPIESEPDAPVGVLTVTCPSPNCGWSGSVLDHPDLCPRCETLWTPAIFEALR